LNFGNGCPVFPRDPGNYKPAAFGFCAQRGGGQPELRGDNAEAQRLIVVDHESDVGRGVHSENLAILVFSRKL
jgi:hypothetical protein